MKILAKILSIGLTAFMLLLIGAVVVLASPPPLPGPHPHLGWAQGSYRAFRFHGAGYTYRRYCYRSSLGRQRRDQRGRYHHLRTQEKADMLITTGDGNHYYKRCPGGLRH